MCNLLTRVAAFWFFGCIPPQILSVFLGGGGFFRKTEFCTHLLGTIGSEGSTVSCPLPSCFEFLILILLQIPEDLYVKFNFRFKHVCDVISWSILGYIPQS